MYQAPLRRVAIGLAAGLAAAGSVAPAMASTTGSTTPADDGAALDELAAASADENTLIIYGNPSDNIWEPILAAFGEAYPDIDVETFDLGGLEAFQRYLSESASGVATADMIIASESVGWLDLVERGDVVDFLAPEAGNIPEFGTQAPGVYAMSVDPLVAMYNEMMIPADEQPTTLAALAALAP